LRCGPAEDENWQPVCGRGAAESASACCILRAFRADGSKKESAPERRSGGAVDKDAGRRTRVMAARLRMPAFESAFPVACRAKPLCSLQGICFSGKQGRKRLAPMGVGKNFFCREKHCASKEAGKDQQAESDALRFFCFAMRVLKGVRPSCGLQGI